jgi:ankyrin repeat protein
LYIAAEKGHVDVVRLLLEAGVVYDKATTDNGTTPLFVAAQNGHVEAVRLLIEAGADFHKAANDGATPLDVAAQEGHMEVLRLERRTRPKLTEHRLSQLRRAMSMVCLC